MGVPPQDNAAAATSPSEKRIDDTTTAAERQTSVSSGQTPTQGQALDQDGNPVELDHLGRPKLPWPRRILRALKTPGSALQIVIAAVFAIGIGMGVSVNVDDIPTAAVQLVGLPGTLWLRALRAVVLPLIMTAMILAVVRLREMTGGGAVLARWTVGYYVLTTMLAIVHSIIVMDLAWRKLMTPVSGSALELSEEDAKTVEERKGYEPHVVVKEMFESFIPQNILSSMANDGLLAVLITSVVVGYLINPKGSIIKAVEEIEILITKVITFLIKIAPIGVFFLILSNLFKLDIADIGQNLGVLIGASLAHMFLHLFVVIPLIVFLFTRENPYPYFFKSSPAWLTAWGTASSAATLPVTIRETLARGIPNTVVKFSVPLGCLINMDGTAIYFPACVVFLAETQGITLNPAQYVIVVLLATLASIGTTPIPSSSLVLTVMIAQSVDVPITGMYAVIIAIDWFIDRFRTATNVSCDIYAAAVVTKMTGIKDTESDTDDDAQRVLDRLVPQGPPTDNTHRV